MTLRGIFRGFILGSRFSRLVASVSDNFSMTGVVGIDEKLF